MTEQPADCSFDPAAAFQRHGSEPLSLIFDASKARNKDEKELVQAVASETKETHTQHGKLNRAQKSRIADQLMSPGGSGDRDNFAARIGEIYRMKPGGFPEVSVEYRNLRLEADALVGSAGNPTVLNSAKAMAARLLMRSGLQTKPLAILDGVSGILKPGRLTLLLGPPGSGKSVFMQLLSGRLRLHKGLRMSGTIHYNGETPDKDFVVQRTAGLVDQYDQHIPNLTVLETVKFAYDCQANQEVAAQTLAALDKAHQLQRQRSAAVLAAVQQEEGQVGVDEPTTTSSSTSKNGDAASLGVEASGEGTSSNTATGGAQSTAATNEVNVDDEEFFELFREGVIHKLKPFMVLRLLGLQDVADTFVGGESLRGVSGGQRKRVTSAEVLAGPQWALFCDEISTGLDSATTYSVVKSLGDLSREMRRTVVVSLLQPPPEVMGLFDDLLLMVDGKVIYHGPMNEAVPFFAQMGFDCPARKDPASFLQEVTTPVGQLLYASNGLLDKHGVPLALRDPATLLTNPPKNLLVSMTTIEKAFWASPVGAAMQQQLDVVTPSQSAAAANPAALARTKYASSGSNLAWVTLRRQVLLLKRDKSYYIARAVQSVIMALIVSSLFASVAPDKGQDPFSQGRKALALCVIAVIYISMSSMPSLSFVFATKRVFYKQRDNLLIPPWAYVLSLAIAQVPSSTIESILFCTVLYFISGLAREAARYFIFLLVVWSSSNCLAGLFRAIAYFAPSMVVANAFGSLFLLFLMITNGFSIVRTSIPSWLLFVYYGLNPLSWAIRALGINELTAPEWGVAGPAILETFGFFTDSTWIWTGVAFLWGFLFLLTALGAVALAVTSPPAPKPTVELEDQKKSVARELSEYVKRTGGAAGTSATNGVAGSGYSWLWKSASMSNRRRSFLSIPPEPPLSSATTSGNVALGTSTAAAAAAAAAKTTSVAGLYPDGLTDEEMARTVSAATDPGTVVLADPPPLTMETSQLDGTAGTIVEGENQTLDSSSTIPFTPITLVCRSISYYVTDPSSGTAPGVVKDTEDKEISGKLQLLKSIDFFAEPGMLTALMGGSGAGKTTLMDVVAGRKTQGIIRGDILVNGKPKDQRTWSRIIGYVEQTDIHSSCITVRESLQFSARLRLDSDLVDDAAVGKVVDDVIETVELGSLAGRVVGDAGGNGLSIEQRKRLSIAVELVANPSVLFMDEPTSGLDARAAAIVMRAVRAVADGNRACVVTIHQPSVSIFESFDALVLLQRGGRLTYFGPLGEESSSLITYLESYSGVDKIRPGYNPATWMLEVTGGSMTTTFASAGIDFPQAYLDSELRIANFERMDELVASFEGDGTAIGIGDGVAGSDSAAREKRYATSFKVQCRELLRKYFSYYWHNPQYNFVRIMVTLVIALVYGLTYLNEGKALYGAESAGVDTVQNIMGLIFSLAIFNGMFNCMTVMPLVSAERTVFYREKAASMYAPRALSIAQGVAELPYLALQSIIMVCIAYWMVGFAPVAWKFFYFLLTFWLTVTMYTFMGQFLVIATPNQLMAQLLAAALNQMFTIFNGFLVPFPQTPRGWKWMNRLSPTSWVLYGLAGSQLADSTVPIDIPTPNVDPADGSGVTKDTVGEFVQDFFEYDPDFVWWCPFILVGYVLFFRLGSAVLLGHVSFQKR